jgi:hypothetical protein
MNKLTLAATLALAMGGYAMAQVCGDSPTVTTSCNPLVYNLNVKVKTTIAKAGKVVTLPGPCEDGQKEIDYACFRVKGSRSLTGFIASCDNWCCENIPAQLAQPAIPAVPGVQATDDQDNLLWTDDDPPLPVWAVEPIPEVPAVPASPATIAPNFNADRWSVYLWENKTKNRYAQGEGFEWDAFWRIGKNNRDLETAWFFESDEAIFQGMGWGSVNKNGIVNNMSGNVIGWLEAPWIENNKICCEAFPFTFCDLEDEDVPTIAFGTWKMKYNAKASAASKATGALPLPKWW